MTYPHQPMKTARDIVRTPLHERLDAHGAVWGQAGAHERPEWFGNAGPGGAHPKGSWGVQAWHKNVEAECLAARNAVAMFDQSSFAKIIVSGRDAEAVLQRVCAAHVARAVGRCVYSLVLNNAGGIESECTVTRLADDRFLVVSGSAMRIKVCRFPSGAVYSVDFLRLDHKSFVLLSA